MKFSPLSIALQVLLFSGFSIGLVASIGNALNDADRVTKDWQTGQVGSDTDFVLLIIHSQVKQVLDFLQDVCGRDSYDDNGAKINSFGHGDEDSAEWQRREPQNTNRFVYGEGNGSTTLSYGTRDLIAHEFGHAITDHTCGLLYGDETGALKEGAGDILAAMVEYYVEDRLTLDVWNIGEDTVVGAGNAFRYMNRPSLDGSSVDHYSNLYTSGSNNENAVANSGILNHWFYLLSQGGKHHNNNFWTSNAVLGITIDVAFDIWYQAWTVKLQPNSKFADAAVATMEACEELGFDVNTICESVRDAWTEVGVVDYFWCPAGDCGPDCGTCCDYKDCATEDPCVTATCPQVGGPCEYDYSGCSTDNLFHMEFHTDKFPGETSWELKDDCRHGGLDRIVLEIERGEYDDLTLHEHNHFLRGGMYTLTVRDSYGDGLCCDHEKGNYTANYNGVQVAFGKRFEFSESHTFGHCWAKLFFEDFEGGWGHFEDGGKDAAITQIYSRFEYYNGQNSLRLRDGSVSSVATTRMEYSVAGFKTLQVHVSFMAKGMEAGESFYLEYQHAGGAWTSARSWTMNSNFYNGIWYTNVVDIDASGMNWKVKLRFRMNGSNNSDRVYIDNVLFQGSIF